MKKNREEGVGRARYLWMGEWRVGSRVCCKVYIRLLSLGEGNI